MSLKPVFGLDVSIKWGQILAKADSVLGTQLVRLTTNFYVTIGPLNMLNFKLYYIISI